ncbi:prephenate dehydrogenase/arogenate dehydrogenase family protein [Meiothermus sp. QL-1]|uniref:prephenate dehydrogenase/arogenate dehydrogenase family protein n=1 Tax=Meiothermus sp. QL-1 TaxID=2058095 RepID=UPI000E0ADA81|nr:prephenate dehydrogenase/arogenate dehydrogenase family protein [Meiothermus sp. QL-1]RDI94816.1 prephenate dehydrogenase/arogenate dehydrogenase family protein [Meiothermus sp. QL-1]
MKPLFTKVGIFGIGLLGGSVALGLRERFLAEEVHAYDPDPKALEDALALQVVDRVHPSPGAWIEELELGVLAAPVGVLVEEGRRLARYSSPSTLWMDVGSVKGPVVEALTGVLPRFVGTHPMAGSEKAGVEAAHAGLLQNAVWVLTPNGKTDPEALAQVRGLVESLGAYPLEISPALHDRLVARVSHLPYLLAVGLNRLVAQDPHQELLMFLAAGGFRDLTRVASGSPRMSRDMVVANKAALKEAVEDLRAVMLELERLLEEPEALLEVAQAAKRTRDALPIVKRSLLPMMHELVVQVPDRPGQIARVSTALGQAGINIKNFEVLAIRDEGGAIRMGFATPEEREQARKILEEIGYRVR